MKGFNEKSEVQVNVAHSATQIGTKPVLDKIDKNDFPKGVI